MARKPFGVFLAPFHCPAGDNPTAAFERDLDVLRLVDRLASPRAGSASTTPAAAS
jgi:limonene 1,2-monooxygenase